MTTLTDRCDKTIARVICDAIEVDPKIDAVASVAILAASRAARLALLAELDAAGWQIVQVEPAERVLRSMATCIDHGFGMPISPDDTLDYRTAGGTRTVEAYQRMMINDMAKCYAEVVGRGYAAAPDPFKEPGE